MIDNQACTEGQQRTDSTSNNCKLPRDLHTEHKGELQGRRGAWPDYEAAMTNANKAASSITAQQFAGIFAFRGAQIFA